MRTTKGPAGGEGVGGDGVPACGLPWIADASLWKVCTMSDDACVLGRCSSGLLAATPAQLGHWGELTE